MFILCIIVGITMGIGAAYLAVNYLILNSNVSGNTKGDFDDFTKTPLVMLESKNKVHRDMPLF